MIPTAWFKNGPYEDGEPLSCLFTAPPFDEQDNYTSLYAEHWVNELHRRIADLELQLSTFTSRYEMKNRECVQRAEERAKFCRGLEKHGLRLTIDHRIESGNELTAEEKL